MAKSSKNIPILLEWDTKFFGFRVAQLTTNRLNLNDMQYVKKFCSEENIRLLQFKCDAHHRPSILIAESNGFHFSDMRMTFSKELNQVSKTYNEELSEATYRESVKEDIPYLINKFSGVFTESRYYFDENFPRKRLDDFYGNWIEKSVLGSFDDFSKVLIHNNIIVGLCTVKISTKGIANIGLFSVNPEKTGYGFGKKLMKELFRELINKNVVRINVVTQGRNFKAQRFYQLLGFSIEMIEIYYHLWLNSDD